MVTSFCAVGANETSIDESELLCDRVRRSMRKWFRFFVEAIELRCGCVRTTEQTRSSFCVNERLCDLASYIYEQMSSVDANESLNAIESIDATELRSDRLTVESIVDW